MAFLGETEEEYILFWMEKCDMIVDSWFLELQVSIESQVYISRLLVDLRKGDGRILRRVVTMASSTPAHAISTIRDCKEATWLQISSCISTGRCENSVNSVKRSELMFVESEIV